MQDTADYQLPTNPKPSIYFGMAIILIFLGGFLLWAITAPLSEAVVASGTVKVDTSRKKVQHLEGGVVKEILVRDGDRVIRGDLLVKLDETQAGASVAILTDGYTSALAQETRLIAERDGLEQLLFPAALTNNLDDSKVKSIIDAQSSLWEARRTAIDGEIKILEKQSKQLNEDISGYKAQTEAKKQELGLVQDELDSMRQLLERGLTGKQRVLELERESARIQGDIAELRSQIGVRETEIAQTELEIFQVGKTFRQSVVEELKQVQAELYDFRERLNAAQYAFEQTEVRSPVNGVVVDSGIHTVGGVVPPGGTLLEVVPDEDSLIVETKIDPKDIDRVKPGLPAGIKFTAFNQRTTPEINGELQYVSADSLQDPQTGLSYYLARVEVPPNETKRLKDNELLPGMMADVFIRSGERTMAQYLIQPLRDSFQRAWLEE